jgi:hypothetical protein
VEDHVVGVHGSRDDLHLIPAEAGQQLFRRHCIHP